MKKLYQTPAAKKLLEKEIHFNACAQYIIDLNPCCGTSNDPANILTLESSTIEFDVCAVPNPVGFVVNNFQCEETGNTTYVTSVTEAVDTSPDRCDHNPCLGGETCQHLTTVISPAPPAYCHVTNLSSPLSSENPTLIPVCGTEDCNAFFGD